MATRTPGIPPVHDGLTARLFEEINEKGYENIRATHLGLPEEEGPEKIYSEKAEMFFSPDISAEKGGVAYMFKIETAGSIGSPFSNVELETLAAHAKDLDAYLYLVVPSGIQGEAQTVLEGIEVKNERKTFVLPT